MSLSMADDGVGVRQLNMDRAPNQASQKLLHTMREVLHGHDILPDSQRDTILASTECCPSGDGREWRYSFGPAEEGEYNLPGAIPTIQQVSLIRERAKLCHDQGQDEAGWNIEVHHLLLSSVFRDSDWCHSRYGFNVSGCTSAQPHSAFLPRDAPAKNVDFCVVAELD